MGHRQVFGVSVRGRRGRRDGQGEEEGALEGRQEVEVRASPEDGRGGGLVLFHARGQGPSRCGLPLWPSHGSPAAGVLLQP